MAEHTLLIKQICKKADRMVRETRKGKKNWKSTTDVAQCGGIYVDPLLKEYYADRRERSTRESLRSRQSRPQTAEVMG